MDAEYRESLVSRYRAEFEGMGLPADAIEDAEIVDGLASIVWVHAGRWPSKKSLHALDPASASPLCGTLFGERWDFLARERIRSLVPGENIRCPVCWDVAVGLMLGVRR
jgi:hypothetical protein